MATCGGFALLPTVSFAGTHLIGDFWALVITKHEIYECTRFRNTPCNPAALPRIEGSTRRRICQRQRAWRSHAIMESPNHGQKFICYGDDTANQLPEMHCPTRPIFRIAASRIVCCAWLAGRHVPHGIGRGQATQGIRIRQPRTFTLLIFTNNI
jgi:hypothetical protein